MNSTDSTLTGAQPRGRSQSPFLSRDRLFIGGSWMDPKGSGTIEVVDATSETVIGSVPEGTTKDAAAAAEAAAAALPDWSSTTPDERADLLRAISNALADRADEIADLITREVGAPYRFSRAVQAGLPARDFLAAADALGRIRWEEPTNDAIVVREPVGVVGAITPWNYPLHQVSAKVAAALAAGCTIVLKPSEVAPLTAFILIEILETLGLPPGVCNLVTGYGPVVGEAIATQPLVDMVSFTGSNVAGKRVMELAAKSVKRVALELGGKSATIVLDDADLDSVVPKAVAGCFRNSGQNCAALTRLLVPEPWLERTEQLACEAATTYTLGDPFDSETVLGPLASHVQRHRVRVLIDTAVDEGAVLLAGGSDAPEGIERGFFVKPTVFSRVTREMTVAREEVFGPVLAIMSYRSEDEAIELANATRYGLSGAVWSTDPTRAERVARQMRTGRVAINGGEFDPMTPFGGFKESGIGRELGRWGVDEFLEVKTLQR